MDKKWKKKAISLSLATTMTIGAPMVFLGCGEVTVNKVGTESVDDDAYHGTGATPFVFPGYEKDAGIVNQTGVSHNIFMYQSNSWRVWQRAKDDNSSYSSGSSSTSKGYSSYIRSSSSS